MPPKVRRPGEAHADGQQGPLRPHLRHQLEVPLRQLLLFEAVCKISEGPIPFQKGKKVTSKPGGELLIQTCDRAVKYACDEVTDVPSEL